MRLGDLRNILCVDVVLVEYVEGNPEGKELFVCHSFDIPEDYDDRIVVHIFPIDGSLHLLLVPEHE